MSYSEEDPLSEPKNVQNLDLSRLTPEELKIYKLYGKLPTKQEILSQKIQDKKYFDSGDYAMSKKSNRGLLPMKHPNAEKVKEIYTRNSISGSNSGVLYNGKLGLLNESTPKKD